MHPDTSENSLRALRNLIQLRILALYATANSVVSKFWARYKSEQDIRVDEAPEYVPRNCVLFDNSPTCVNWRIANAVASQDYNKLQPWVTDIFQIMKVNINTLQTVENRVCAIVSTDLATHAPPTLLTATSTHSQHWATCKRGSFSPKLLNTKPDGVMKKVVGQIVPQIHWNRFTKNGVGWYGCGPEHNSIERE